MVCPTISGMTVERRLQVLMTFFSPFSLSASTFLRRWSSTKGPFFRLRGMGFLPPAAARTAPADDELLGWLGLVAGAALGLAPRRDGMATAGRLALAATEGVVDRVHGDAAGLGLDALPAVAAGLADLDQLGFGVADLADGGAAVDRDAAHLGARQAQGGEVAFLGHELHGRAGGAAHLGAAAGVELDGVHRGAHGDVAQRQAVAGTDLGAVPVLQGVADLHVLRGEHVALLAVEVVEEEDATVAVRVVLDGRDLGRHAVLVPLEVDDAVALLVAAALVSSGLAAVVVAATGVVLRGQQGALGRVLGDLREVGDRLEPTTGAGGLALAKGHVSSIPGTGRSSGPRRG